MKDKSAKSQIWESRIFLHKERLFFHDFRISFKLTEVSYKPVDNRLRDVYKLN